MIYCRNCENREEQDGILFCKKVNFYPTNEQFCSCAERKKGTDPWDAVIEVAKAEVGYKETGYNINKYAEYFDTVHPEFYKLKKQGLAWCGIFADWCFAQAYGFETMKKMLFRPDVESHSCGVKDAYKYYDKNSHMFHGHEMKVGDQVMFGQNWPWRTYDHTGIIISVEDENHYTTIEGNAGYNCDGVYIVKRTYADAIGWGRPNWEALMDNE